MTVLFETLTHLTDTTQRYSVSLSLDQFNKRTSNKLLILCDIRVGVEEAVEDM